MAILHLIRCDECAKDTPMTVSHSSFNINMQTGLSGQAGPQLSAPSFSVPQSIKQIDGRHFCSWACVGAYAAGVAKHEAR